MLIFGEQSDMVNIWVIRPVFNCRNIVKVSTNKWNPVPPVSFIIRVCMSKTRNSVFVRVLRKQFNGRVFGGIRRMDFDVCNRMGRRKIVVTFIFLFFFKITS